MSFLCTLNWPKCLLFVCRVWRKWMDSISFLGPTSSLLLIITTKNIFRYHLSPISLTTSWAPSMILWILLFGRIYLQLKSSSLFLYSIPSPNFFYLQFCLDHMLGTLLSLVNFVSNSSIVLSFSHIDLFPFFLSLWFLLNFKPPFPSWKSSWTSNPPLWLGKLPRPPTPLWTLIILLYLPLLPHILLLVSKWKVIVAVLEHDLLQASLPLPLL